MRKETMMIRIMTRATIKFVLIGILWQILELIFYREIQPRIVDDIIGLIIYALLMKNEAWKEVWWNGNAKTKEQQTPEE